MKLTPLKNKLIVEEITETKTKSGLYLPEDQRGQPLKKAMVIESGSGEIKKGEKVIFPSEKGHAAQINEKNYLLIHTKDVWLVL